MARIKICKEEGCKAQATTSGLCRLHYLKRWKEIRRKKKQQAAKRLNNYIEHMCTSHPENYVEKIRTQISDGDAPPSAEPNGQGRENFFFKDEEAEEEIRHLLTGVKIEKDF